MNRALFPISLLLSSAACSSQAEYARQAGIEEDPAQIPAPAAQPAAFEDKDRSGAWERSFTYQWPAQAAAQPELAASLSSERDRLLAQEKSEWAAAISQCPADSVGCGTRSYAMEWQVVADTPGFLSLSGDFSTYTGGAHGMYGRRSLVWDKTARKAFDGVALFASPAALDTALGQRLCDALNAEREKRRGEPVGPAGGPDDIGFDSCQKVADATVLVGSSNGRTFDRIGIWFGPYVAGAYAEGAYELTFPVDERVLAAVKPQYRGAFGGDSRKPS